MAAKLLKDFLKTGKTYWRETLAVLFLLNSRIFYQVGTERTAFIG